MFTSTIILLIGIALNNTYVFVDAKQPNISPNVSILAPRTNSQIIQSSSANNSTIRNTTLKVDQKSENTSRILKANNYTYLISDSIQTEQDSMMILSHLSQLQIDYNMYYYYEAVMNDMICSYSDLHSLLSLQMDYVIQNTLETSYKLIECVKGTYKSFRNLTLLELIIALLSLLGGGIIICCMSVIIILLYRMIKICVSNIFKSESVGYGKTQPWFSRIVTRDGKYIRRARFVNKSLSVKRLIESERRNNIQTFEENIYSCDEDENNEDVDDDSDDRDDKTERDDNTEDGDNNIDNRNDNNLDASISLSILFVNILLYVLEITIWSEFEVVDKSVTAAVDFLVIRKKPITCFVTIIGFVLTEITISILTGLFTGCYDDTIVLFCILIVLCWEISNLSPGIYGIILKCCVFDLLYLFCVFELIIVANLYYEYVYAFDSLIVIVLFIVYGR
eukprot:531845_1